MKFNEWWDTFQRECPIAISKREIALAAWMGAITLDEEYSPRSSECYITLSTFGENKINAIKTIRDFTNFGLRESKDITESLPKNIRGVRKTLLRRLTLAWNVLPGAKSTFHDGKCYLGECESCFHRFSCLTGS